MRNIIIITIIIMVILPLSIIHAQDINPAKLNYYQQELYVNPAYAGSLEMFSSTLVLQKQWIDIEKSPSMQRLQMHSPFWNNKLGLGLSFQNETFGVTHKMAFSTQYAYRFKIGGCSLALGMQLGFVTFQENYAELDTYLPDPVFAENTSLMWGFNCGLGTYFSTDKFYVGVSTPNIISNNFADDKLISRLEIDKIPVYFSTGVLLDLTESFKLKPLALLSYSKNNNFAYNIGATAFFKEAFWLGILIRYDNEVGGMVGLNMTKNINIGYKVSFSHGDLLLLAGQKMIHEVSLGVSFRTDKRKMQFKYF